MVCQTAVPAPRVDSVVWLFHHYLLSSTRLVPYHRYTNTIYITCRPKYYSNYYQLHIISFDMGNDICLNVHVGTYQYIPFRPNDHLVSRCLTNIFEVTELNNRISVNTQICCYIWICFTLVQIVISLSLHIVILVNSRTVYLSHERYHKTVTCNRLYNTITIVSNHLRLPFKQHSAEYLLCCIRMI